MTVLAGTGHTAFSTLPVITEVAKEQGIRPSRPLSIAVVASQIAITASPISAAVVFSLVSLNRWALAFDAAGHLYSGHAAGGDAHRYRLQLPRLRTERRSGLPERLAKSDCAAAGI
nr:anaerobic C4-dicarboxylate transporter family protein [Klebsiella pneumoniae]